MAEDKKMGKIPHNLILEDRARLSVSGINDVDSYDESTIVAFTNMGTLTITGTDLHIDQLSIETGDLLVQGEILSLSYTNQESKRTSFLSRLFK